MKSWADRGSLMAALEAEYGILNAPAAISVTRSVASESVIARRAGGLGDLPDGLLVKVISEAKRHDYTNHVAPFQAT